jgi:hypothetical protein
MNKRVMAAIILGIVILISPMDQWEKRDKLFLCTLAAMWFWEDDNDKDQ